VRVASDVVKGKGDVGRVLSGEYRGREAGVVDRELERHRASHDAVSVAEHASVACVGRAASAAQEGK
jgi:hypothetical protein